LKKKKRKKTNNGGKKEMCFQKKQAEKKSKTPKLGTAQSRDMSASSQVNSATAPGKGTRDVNDPGQKTQNKKNK